MGRRRRRPSDPKDATSLRAFRDVELLAPLAQDLAEWRLLCGRPSEDSVIVPTTDGDAWERYDWQNWRRRVWRLAALAAGVIGDLRPYRLRGSFVSLRLWEGRSLSYVAEQARHSVATLAKHYAGVIKELEDQPRVPSAEAIREARERLACSTGRQPRKLTSRESPATTEWAILGSNQ